LGTASGDAGGVGRGGGAVGRLHFLAIRTMLTNAIELIIAKNISSKSPEGKVLRIPGRAMIAATMFTHLLTLSCKILEKSTIIMGISTINPYRSISTSDKFRLINSSIKPSVGNSWRSLKIILNKMNTHRVDSRLCGWMLFFIMVFVF
jgi:hypothetical protein